jgi:hypothetical protein
MHNFDELMHVEHVLDMEASVSSLKILPQSSNCNIWKITLVHGCSLNEIFAEKAKYIIFAYVLLTEHGSS